MWRQDVAILSPDGFRDSTIQPRSWELPADTNYEKRDWEGLSRERVPFTVLFVYWYYLTHSSESLS